MKFVLKCRKLTICSIIQYMIVFFSIIMTGGIWARLILENNTVNVLSVLICVLCICYICIKISRGVKCTGRVFSYIAFISFCMLVTVVAVPAYWLKAVISLYGPMIVIVLFSGYMSYDEKVDFFTIYIKTVYIIAIVSLIFYIGGTILSIIPSTGFVNVLWEKDRDFRSYFHLHYDSISWQFLDILGLEGARNTSIFAEGPMYGFCLTIAYILNRTYCKLDKKINIVLLVTLITTATTTSIIAIMCYEGICFIFKKLKNNKINLLKNMLVPIVIIICSFLLVTLIDSKSASSSYSIRMDHMMGCIDAFKDNFWFGCGIENKDKVLQYVKYKQGFSIGLPYLFAQGGFLSVLVLAVPFFSYIVANIRYKQYEKIAFAIAVFVLYYMTNITFNSRIQWFILGCVFVTHPIKRVKRQHIMEKRNNVK